MRWILIGTLILFSGCVQKHLNEADKPSEVPTATELEGVWKLSCTSGSDGFEQQKYTFSGAKYSFEKVFYASSSSCSDGYRLIESGQLTVGTVDSNNHTQLNLSPDQFIVAVDSSNAASYLNSVSGNMGGADGACGLVDWQYSDNRDVSDADCTNINFITSQQSRYDIYQLNGTNLTLGTYSTGYDGMASASRFINLSAATFTKL